ncbi:MAG: hypothetical protein ACSHYB_08595 [Roseibacillus sp.]
MEQRFFSDLEKEIIQRMLDIDAKRGYLVLNNLLAEGTHKGLLSFDSYIDLKSEHEVVVKVKKASFGTNQIKKLDWEVSKIIVTVVELFKYLEESRLVLGAGKYKPSAIGTVWQDEEYIDCHFVAEDVKPSIYKLAGKQFWVSQSLRELAERNFASQEEIRHKAEIAGAQRNLRNSKIATRIAMAGLIISLILPFSKSDSVTISNESLKATVEVPELKILQTIEEDRQAERSNIEATMHELEFVLEKLSKEDLSNISKLEEDRASLLLGIGSLLDALEIQKASLSDDAQNTKPAEN